MDNLRAITGERRLVGQNIASWNHITSWLRRVEALREAAPDTIALNVAEFKRVPALKVENWVK